VCHNARKDCGNTLSHFHKNSSFKLKKRGINLAHNYALGDVDMDGFITGHDAAMVTHALYVDNEALTAEQLKLADVNGDGVVDQSDADWIHENQVYELGQMDKTSQLDVVTVYFQLYCVARSGAGNACSNVKGADLLDSVLDYNDEFSEVCYNLMDVNGDGVLDNTDALLHWLTWDLWEQESKRPFILKKDAMISQWILFREP